MTRDELIAALEVSAGPSRELDAEIGRIAGLEIHDAEHQRVPSAMEAFYQEIIGIPRYTESLDDALSLVQPGHEWLFKSPHVATVYRVPENDKDWAEHFDGKGATDAIALCLAAIRARGTGEG